MRKLRYCKRCSEVFEGRGKCSRICDNCRKSNTGWHYHIEKKGITEVLGDHRWKFGAYDKKKVEIK